MIDRAVIEERRGAVVKVHYIACAKSSAVDGQTNQLSLFHVLDEIAGAAFPLTLPSFCVASLFEREPDDGPEQAFVLAITLDEALLASFTMKVDFAKSRRNRSVNTIQGLTIPAAGAVSISILQRSKILAVWHALAIQIGESKPQPRTAEKAGAKEGPTLAIKTTAVLN